MDAIHTTTCGHATKVTFPFKGGSHTVRPDQIIRLEANSNYTYIHLLGRKPILMAKVLSAYEDLLLPFGFIRTHRSHLVNRHHIQYVAPDGCIVMDDDSKAEISRRKRRDVIHKILHAPSAA